MKKATPWRTAKGGIQRRQLRILFSVGLLLVLLGWFARREKMLPSESTASSDGTSTPHSPTARVGDTAAIDSAHGPPSGPDATPEQIVAGKVSQFAQDRRIIAQEMAGRLNVETPPEVEQFFDAVAAGDWERTKALFESLSNRHNTPPRSPGLDAAWPAVMETFGVAEVAHSWPAKKLLDYGNSILGALRPGMVYVGGTDTGRFIPTLLNETGDNERHIVLTQNALADVTYLQYLDFLYKDRFNTLTSDDSQIAFASYVEDVQKRLLHDQEFPNEPKQVLPGEDIQISDGRVQVSGQTAVMAINEKLIQTLQQKNPGLAFAVEESFPMKSTYAEATPIGPIIELGAGDNQSGLTADRAAKAVEYWQTTARQLLSDPEASSSSDTLASYSKLATGHANLFGDRHQIAAAEQAYQIAIEILPRNIEAVAGLSDLYSRNSRADEARMLRDEFARNHPDLTAELERLIQNAASSSARSPAGHP